MLFFVGGSQTYPSGNKLVHGQRGEVVGPATGENTKGKALKMRFPGNKGTIDCYLTLLSREPPVRGHRGGGRVTTINYEQRGVVRGSV